MRQEAEAPATGGRRSVGVLLQAQVHVSLQDTAPPTRNKPALLHHPTPCPQPYSPVTAAGLFSPTLGFRTSVTANLSIVWAIFAQPLNPT